MLCVATNCLVAAVDPMPRIVIAVTMEDTTPQPLLDGFATVAVNTRSLWETDSIGVRLTMNLSWGLRHPSGAAFVSSVTW